MTSSPHPAPGGLRAPGAPRASGACTHASGRGPARGLRAGARAAAACALALALSGCYSFEMTRIGRSVAHDIEATTGADVGGPMSVSVGPVSLATAQLGAWVFAPQSSREARLIGRHVASVKFSRRPIRGAFDGRLVGEPASLQRYKRNGWYPFVTVRDSSAAVWVMLRERGRPGREEITNVLAVVAAEDDLILTKVSGNLSGLIREAIAIGRADGALGDALEQAGLIEPDDDAEDDAGDGDANEPPDATP